ncbi:hypothetical protein AL479_23565 [Citrobacter amalonaticus]|nr:hypothetical protein AL479_23565 [Citrobacter amalonaticus]
MPPFYGFPGIFFQRRLNRRRLFPLHCLFYFSIHKSGKLLDGVYLQLCRENGCQGRHVKRQFGCLF